MKTFLVLARSLRPGALLMSMTMVFAAPSHTATLKLQPVLTSQATPVSLAHTQDGRLFLTLISGLVIEIQGNELGGVISTESPYLDLRDRVSAEAGLGLWSIALAPDHPQNPFVYAHFAERNSDDSIVSRFELFPDGSAIDASTEVVLLRMPKTRRLHYGGQLSFGPDGHLWISTGESTGRQGVPDPECLAQSLDSLEGKILRIDVDGEVDQAPYYSIPSDNPFPGGARPEIWALGLRNPWRFSFDREAGDLWIADVGHLQREEIDFVPAGAPGGHNFGWKRMEGNRCVTDARGCATDLPPCGDPAYSPPLLEYDHSGTACSVIGGYVYRGRLVPELNGRYVYGDFCSGDIWAAPAEPPSAESTKLSPVAQSLVSFGEDAGGELYVLTLDTLYRLVDESLPAGGLIELEQTSFEANEGSGSVEIQVLRVGATQGAASARVSVSSGTAEDGSDFLASTTVLRWEDGEGGAHSVFVDVLDDTDDEPSETVSVTLDQVSGEARAGARTQAHLLIRDNDLCTPSATDLCLAMSRFQVSALWSTPQGASGQARALSLTGDTGAFWFFRESNVELLVKSLDGCGVNGHFWVFAAGLTNVGVTLVVTDSLSGISKTYESPLGEEFRPVQDIAAFATCP